MSHFITHPPAKINLSLEITGKRDDGFHELKTLVLPIPNLTDEVHFDPAEQFSLHCDTPGVPTDETNLVSRALRLFEKNTGTACPFKITLKKKIPHGAGLGGGSADAAHTFLALNKLTESSIPLEELAAWSGELGSDIPLFIYQSPCWCRGRGEIVEPVDLNWKHPIVLFKPSFDIPTPWAYSQWQSSQEIPGIPYTPAHVDQVALVNDLERPVFEKHRFLAELKHFLLNQAEVRTAMMSGSGSTVFAVLHNSEEAPSLIERTLAELDPNLWHHLAIF